MSADGQMWFLLNASPEIRQQIESFAPLHPRPGRNTPIAGILLNNGDLDHCLGLLSLRESQPLSIWATDRVRRGFTENNVLYRTLQRFAGHVVWQRLELEREQALTLGPGEASGLSVRTFAIPGKPALHLMPALVDPEDNVGFRIRNERSGKTLAYLPAVAAMAPAVADAVAGVDAVFFDGTFWSSDELIALGLGEKRAEDMAHWPVGGSEGSLSTLSELDVPIKVLIHMNNTNPLLRDDSAEREAVRQARVAVAYDGMEFEL